MVLVFRQGLEILRFIQEEPRQPAEIAARFGCSRRTVERILRTAEAFGLDIQVKRAGRGAWYRLGASLPLRSTSTSSASPTGGRSRKKQRKQLRARPK